MHAVPLPARSWPRVPALIGALGLCLSVLAPAAPAQAATLTVTTTTDELNADGDCSLREAVTAANTNSAVDACLAGGAASDTVTVPAGTYVLTLDADGLPITSDLELVGAGVGVTILDGNDLHRIARVSTGSTVQIRGVTMQHGVDFYSSTPSGGAISNAGTLTLRSSEVADSAASIGGSGGGIANYGILHVIDSMVRRNALLGDVQAGGGIANFGDLRIINSIISDNRIDGPSGGGGGIYNNGDLRIINSIISDNRICCNEGQQRGGGIRNDGTADVVGSLITRNSSYEDGGGIYTQGTLTVDQSTISGNRGRGTGGGIGTLGPGTVTLRNSTVSGNLVHMTGHEYGGYCGGIGGGATLINVTVTDNAATGEFGGVGGGICGGTLRNSIVAGNRADNGGPDCAGTLQSQDYNLIQTTAGCTVAGETTGNLLNVDARLGPLADNGGPTPTHALLPGSPALDAGHPAPPGSGASACEATDQRGVPRPQDGDANGAARCDIGAFELQGAAGCPPGAGVIAAYRYTITRGSHTLEVADLTGRVQPGDRITAVVTVAPGCTAVPVGLVSYQAQAPTYNAALEQVLFAQDARVVASGERQLAVEVPTCYFQVDLIVGPVLARIGPPNDYYRQRQVDYATGGSSACPAFAPSGPAPSPSPAPSGAPGPASIHKTFVGLVTQ